jgi:hypothetical protein
MAFKRITEKQRKNGICWCEKCKREGKGKVRAEWHGYFQTLCQDHYNEEMRRPSEEMSLADEMTWGRL